MNISVVLVSRGRPEMLEKLYLSLVDTCELPFELIVGCDSDDISLGEYFNLLSSYDNIKFVVDKRSDNLHTKMNNMLPLVQGEHILVMNDDCLLTNKGWDRLAKEKMSGPENLYGRTHDNSIDRVSQDYAAFPLIKTEAARKLGLIMDARFGNHGSDVVTYRIYSHTRQVVDLPEVKIDHTFHNSQQGLEKRKGDKTANEMIGRTFSDPKFSVNELFNCNVMNEVLLLNE
jgi:glycosyltransferase involved in cell wall biosynthesis